MIRRLISLLFAAIFIGNCAPASPAPPTPATATQTIAPFETPSFTPTSIPETNEHLIITRDLEHWAVLNADGNLKKYIQVPDIARPSEVSPDGNWLDYEFGSYEDEPYDLSLNLLNLNDGTSQLVTNLLSPDFPENIEAIVESTYQYDQSLYGDNCTSLECRRSLVKDDVAISAGISRWSPDGQSLAFAAQIDGPSTDIYIYSMQEKTIRRLTDDLQNVYRMEWSPDGRYLLYVNNIPGIIYTGRTFHVTDLEGGTLQLSQEVLSKAPEWYMHGWISDNLYLLQANYPDPGQRHFRELVIANIEDGQMKEIWQYHTNEVAVDTDNQAVIFSFSLYSFDDPIPNAPDIGTYLIFYDGEYEKISDQVFSYILSSYQVLGTEEGVAYHILGDGSIKRIGPTDRWGLTNSSSPNKKWFFLDEGDDEGRQRFSLYDVSYQQINSWVIDGELVDTTWRPDSLGIFLITRDNIYYLSIPDGEPKLLDVEVPSCPWGPVACTWPRFAWRP